MNFLQNQTMSGEQFFAAMEQAQRDAWDYHNSRYFVPVSDKLIVDHVIKYSRHIVSPYALTRTNDWPFVHIHFDKREFRQWLKECQIHTFCFFWETQRMMIVGPFSGDGTNFFDYERDKIVRWEKPEDRRDYQR